MTTVAHPHADHVGSLLRPPGVLEAAARRRAGRITAQELAAIEDAAILEALRLQRQVGLELFTDGEYRRAWFADAWIESIEGFVAADGSAATTTLGWHGSDPSIAMAVATPVGTGAVIGAPVRQTRRLAADESAFLAVHAPGPFKITLPGVVSQAMRWFRPGITDAVYATRGELVEALTEVLTDEVTQLVEEGVASVQLDSLVYVIQLCDPDKRAELRAAGEDLDEILGQAIASDNATLEPARAAGVVTGLHMCRGNNRSQWVAQGGYEPIAERAFGELRVDRLLLDYDSERAGGFEPLRFVAPDTTVVLGLISTKTPHLGPRTICCAGSRRRAATCRCSGWRSARSAGSPRSRPAT